MKTFVTINSFFYAIFHKNNIKVIDRIEKLPYYDVNDCQPTSIILELEINNKIEKVKLINNPYPDSALKNNPTKKLTDLEYDYLINPPDNSVLIFDRWIYQRYFQFIFEQYGIAEFLKLINRYKEKNVKVIFNFAFFEPNEYESLYYFLMNYEYGFDCLKLTDYELFKNQDKFIFSKTLNIFHILGDLMCNKVNNYVFTTNYNNKNNIEDIFYVEPIKNAEKIYSHLTLKPRPHRINFINKLFDYNIVDYGYCTLNKMMYQEYEQKKKEGMIYSTDNSLNQTNWLHDYFKNMDYRGYDYYSTKMPDTLGKELWAHLRHYYEYKEYKKSYIDVIGETHILFNTMYPYFSEKSYYPILTEKFFIIYGANSFYKMLEKLDCYNSLDLFGLNSTYYEIENPYEQSDIIAEKLKELIDKINKGEFNIQKYYEENRYKLIDTKKKILNAFSNDTEYIKNFIYK